MKPEERHTHLELCIPYVFGRLNPGNRKQFETHLGSGCAECSKELAQLYEAMALLPLTIHQQQPPQQLKGILMQRIGSGKEAPEPVRIRTEQRMPDAAVSPPQRPWFGYAIAFVLLVIIVALGIYVNDLFRTVGAQEQTIVELRTELAHSAEVEKILQARRVEIVLLNGLEPSSTAFGRIIWDPLTKNAVIQVSGLPATPDDKVYQLWVVKRDGPVNAGVFTVTSEKDRKNFFELVSLTVGERYEFEAFMVTLESKGGAAQPTEPKYLMGTTKAQQ